MRLLGKGSVKCEAIWAKGTLCEGLWYPLGLGARSRRIARGHVREVILDRQDGDIPMCFVVPSILAEVL